jgi:REP element-mobilizing transposase RayT
VQRYFITFSCYGGHLHGDEAGSVDRLHNLPGGRLVEADRERASAEHHGMNRPPYLLDHGSRAAVLESLREVCLHRGWNLLAAHVRTSHVHVIVEAGVRPERVMNDLKSHASRGLNRLGRDGQIEVAGRVMEARDGYGTIGICRKPSVISSRSRANPWQSSPRTCADTGIGKSLQTRDWVAEPRALSKRFPARQQTPRACARLPCAGGPGTATDTHSEGLAQAGRGRIHGRLVRVVLP